MAKFGCPKSKPSKEHFMTKCVFLANQKLRQNLRCIECNNICISITIRIKVMRPMKELASAFLTCQYQIHNPSK